jgi:hypothetical protein
MPIAAVKADSSGRRNTRIERSCGGQAEAAEVGSGGAAGDAFAGSAAGLAQGASRAVLGCDRLWRDERGCWGGGWGFARGWRPMVSRGWRSAVGHPGTVVGALLVVC